MQHFLHNCCAQFTLDWLFLQIEHMPAGAFDLWNLTPPFLYCVWNFCSHPFSPWKFHGNFAEMKYPVQHNIVHKVYVYILYWLVFLYIQNTKLFQCFKCEISLKFLTNPFNAFFALDFLCTLQIPPSFKQHLEHILFTHWLVVFFILQEEHFSWSSSSISLPLENLTFAFLCMTTVHSNGCLAQHLTQSLCTQRELKSFFLQSKHFVLWELVGK